MLDADPVCVPAASRASLFSLISTGTEMMKLAEAKMSMVGAAGQVRNSRRSSRGAVATYKKVMNRLTVHAARLLAVRVVVEVGQA